jgi:arginine-tRNA-protein transferase
VTPTLAYPACPFPALPPPIRIPLTVCPEHPCPYLPDRVAKSRAFSADTLPPDLYHQFMDANFRRSGTIFYQPICKGCRACMQIRVPVERFAASKSQRRCRKRNEDLSFSVGRPVSNNETYALYCRYLAMRHDGMMSDDREGFEAFLCRSAVDTITVSHRDRSGRLLAVGVCDVSSEAISSVYFYYEPAESRRGLGTLGALVEIEIAERLGIPYYYLGYWISGCRKMEYKATFRPCEALHSDGVWREVAQQGEPGAE